MRMIQTWNSESEDPEATVGPPTWMEVYECGICGALVADMEQHAEWHSDLFERITSG